MVLTDHFRGVSRSPHLHMDTWHCCGCCLRSSVLAAQLELPASSWYLAADGSLSMLPDTSNRGLQYHVTLDVQMAWSYCYFAVMVARIAPSLCMPCRISTALLRHAATSGKSWPTMWLEAPQNFLLPLYSSPMHMVT